MGLADVETTYIYTHVMEKDISAVYAGSKPIPEKTVIT